MVPLRRGKIIFHMLCLRRRVLYDKLWKDGLLLGFPYTRTQDEDLRYFMLEVILRSRSEGVRRVEHHYPSCLEGSGGWNLPAPKKSAEDHAELSTRICWLLSCLVEDALCSHGWRGSFSVGDGLSEETGRESPRWHTVVTTVSLSLRGSVPYSSVWNHGEPSRCNTGLQH